MKRFLFYVLTIWLVLWAQVLHNHYLGGSRFSVDLILIVVLYFGLLRGPVTGQVMGFVWGLLIDASSLGVMGLHGLLYALAGYGAGMLRRQLDESKAFTQVILTFAVSVCYTGLYLVLDHLFATTTRSMGWQLAVQPLVNAFLAPIFFWSVHAWVELWQLFPAEN
ncbi:MAG: rod shape-determining protein MreD [Elusimicrobiota bacterium]